jgi:hypothetical protein
VCIDLNGEKDLEKKIDIVIFERSAPGRKR